MDLDIQLPASKYIVEILSKIVYQRNRDEAVAAEAYLRQFQKSQFLSGPLLVCLTLFSVTLQLGFRKSFWMRAFIWKSAFSLPFTAKIV
jgi:hypothetical protein